MNLKKLTIIKNIEDDSKYKFDKMMEKTIDTIDNFSSDAKKIISNSKIDDINFQKKLNLIAQIIYFVLN